MYTCRQFAKSIYKLYNLVLLNQTDTHRTKRYEFQLIELILKHNTTTQRTYAIAKVLLCAKLRNRVSTQFWYVYHSFSPRQITSLILDA